MMIKKLICEINYVTPKLFKKVKNFKTAYGYTKQIWYNTQRSGKIPEDKNLTKHFRSKKMNM